MRTLVTCVHECIAKQETGGGRVRPFPLFPTLRTTVIGRAYGFFRVVVQDKAVRGSICKFAYRSGRRTGEKRLTLAHNRRGGLNNCSDGLA